MVHHRPFEKETSKAADVLSRRIDTACRSRLTGCSQTFGRKPRFCLNTPAWFYNSLVFCWEELELKLACEGEKHQIKFIFCHLLFSRQAEKCHVYSQFAQLLPSTWVADHHLLHSAPLWGEQNMQAPQSLMFIQQLHFTTADAQTRRDHRPMTTQWSCFSIWWNRKPTNNHKWDANFWILMIKYKIKRSESKSWRMPIERQICGRKTQLYLLLTQLLHCN